MQRKEIEKVYIKKINKLKKYDKAYFENDDPIISDRDYDSFKNEIFYYALSGSMIFGTILFSFL